MANINGIIPPQNFERIALAIGEILTSEIRNQEQLIGETLVNEIFYERYIPIDATEMPSINVQYAGGDYSGKDQTMTQGEYLYYISVMTYAENTSNVPGYLTATRKLQKLLGMCRAILENPIHNNLDFEPRGFIRSTAVTAMRIPRNEDNPNADATVAGWIEFKVRAAEYVTLVEPKFLANSITRVRLYMTRKGYVWGPDEDTTYLEAEAAEANNPIYLINQSGAKYLIKE